MSIAIVDAGPLLFLSRLNRLELLRNCADKVYVPNAVLEEIDKKQDEATGLIKNIWIVLDDQDARRTARRIGFKLIGTIGLLLVGKNQGRVDSVRNELDKLVENGFWISDNLRKEALREAGEIE